jgi:hypothetical protein
MQSIFRASATRKPSVYWPRTLCRLPYPVNAPRAPYHASIDFRSASACTDLAERVAGSFAFAFPGVPPFRLLKGRGHGVPCPFQSHLRCRLHAQPRTLKRCHPESIRPGCLKGSQRRPHATLLASAAVAFFLLRCRPFSVLCSSVVPKSFGAPGFRHRFHSVLRIPSPSEFFFTPKFP